MNFQALPSVEFPDELLDKAFSRARKRADFIQSTKGKNTDTFMLQKKVAYEKLLTVKKNITKDLKRVIDAYPDFSGLPEFYEELVKTQLDIDELKLSLGRLQGIIRQMNDFAAKTSDMVRKADNLEEIQRPVDAFYGRMSSSLKKASDAFDLLAKARKILTTFPALKEDHQTVALAGFPNVGKSTLLSQITSSKPKIANYAFTTKNLNVGYYKQGYEDVQVVDTPGTLARFDTMNWVEQQAYLCLKYVADIIVMIIDPTETYPISDQEKLLDEIKDHDKPIIVYLSKTDIANKDDVHILQEKFSAIIDQSELKGKIKRLLKEL